jgi:hypothetical protein
MGFGEKTCLMVCPYINTGFYSKGIRKLLNSQTNRARGAVGE